MFRHIYVNRLKRLVRDRNLVFWTLLYPIVLAVFFNLAFSNLSSADVFKSIPIAVIDNEEFRSQAAFESALDQVGSSGSQLFKVELTTKALADSKLESGEISGYIFFDNGAHVVFNSSGIQQNIIKEFMDTYLQAASAYTTIIKQSPTPDLGSNSNQSHLEGINYGSKATPNTSVAYFYALIAMAALFGSFWGKEEVEDIQADMTSYGARMNMAPVHKLKAFCYSFCASITMHFLSMIVFVAFLQLILHVDFGSQIGYIIITCFFGSLAGVSFGAVLAAIIRKGSKTFRMSIMIALSLIMSSLAGLNNLSVKYTVTHAIPVMAYINPANLIADAFYSLYYYTTYGRFFLNIILLFCISAVFLLIVYFSTRRQKYASI